MSKHKSSTKDKEKCGQLVIRVDKSDRAAFIAHCEKMDTTAAREIRRFMREFIAAGTPAVTTAVAADPVEPPAEPARVAKKAPLAPIVTAEVLSGEAPADTAKKSRRRVKP